MTTNVESLRAEIGTLNAYLKHSRGCDGIRCGICNQIDRRLEDGPKYAVEDHLDRLDLIKQGIQETAKLSGQLADALESAAVQPGVRATSLQVVRWLSRIERVIDEPITKGVRTAFDSGNADPPARSRPVVQPQAAAPSKPFVKPKRTSFIKPMRTPFIGASS